jgi:hypothetical protein
MPCQAIGRSYPQRNEALAGTCREIEDGADAAVPDVLDGLAVMRRLHSSNSPVHRR